MSGDALFELLFKYRPLVFERGELAFGVPWPAVVVVAAAAALAIPAVATYRKAPGDARPWERGVMAGLRLAALAILVVCLFQPTLVVTSTVPRRNFVGVIVEDSESMSIADDGETPRSDFVRRAFGGADAPLLRELSERFAVRFFRFSRDAGRLEGVGGLGFDGSGTRIGPALELAAAELEGVPLSGLVLVTDGADGTEGGIAGSLLPLRSAGVPVYAVGVGAERPEQDVELSRVELPRQILAGSAVGVTAVLTQHGYAGRSATVRVESEGRILATREVELPSDGEPVVTRLRFTAREAGPRTYRVVVPELPGETVAPNNVREVLASVEDRTERILYFEGEPRFEVKFVRRAVADDENVRLTVLQRTAENKFLRLGVESARELAGGFPRTREELYRYRGLVLGSVEAGYFTHDQLRMIADFVSRRGGGLLVLGGGSAFARGDYDGTPVEEVLPVVLDDREPLAGGSFFAELDVRPTRSGRGHPALRLADEAGASAERWTSLPPVTSVNPVRELKPGATSLLVGDELDAAGERVVMAWHRYGRGKVIAFPVQDSWIWQMHADIPVDDGTHETLWRQLLRWLAEGVPDPVEARSTRDRVEPGTRAELRATVEDSTFLGVNDGRVRAVVRRVPSGSAGAGAGAAGETVAEADLPWTGEEDGEYRGGFVPDGPGLYRVDVTAYRGDEPLGSDVAFVRAGPSRREFFDAAMRRGLLERIAEETGGRFYTPATAAGLPEDVTVTGGGMTLTEERDLWDMPVVFLLLVGLVGAEWAFRRVRRLA